MADEISARINIEGGKDAIKTLKDVGDAAKKLDGESIDVDVDADTKAALKGLGDVEKKVDKLDGESADVKVDADTTSARSELDDLLDKVSKLDGESASILLAANATEVAGEIADLIIDLDRLDANDPQVDIKVGQIESLKGDLDTIEAKIREINSTPVDIDTSPAVGGIDRIRDSSDQTGSVLANMVGNSVQDLGALGGVAGSTGMLLGQLGEYATEGNIGLQELAATAPILLAVVAAVSAVTGAMEYQAGQAEAAAERTKEFGEAMRDAGDNTLGLTNAIRDTIPDLKDFTTASLLGEGSFGEFMATLNQGGRAIPLLGRLFQDLEVDVVGAMNDAGLSIYQFADAANGSEAEAAAFLQLLEDFRDAGFITSDQFHGMSEAFGDYRSSIAAAKEEQKLFNVSADEANAILGETLAQADPLSQYADKWGVLSKDMADGTINTKEAADAINFLTDNLGLSNEEVIQLAQQNLDEKLDADREAAWAFAEAMADVSMNLDEAFNSSEAFSTALDRLNSASSLDMGQMFQDTVKSFDDVKGALDDIENKSKIDWSDFDITPDEYDELKGMPEQLAAVTDAVSGMRGSIQTELQAAFDTGGIDAYSEKADFFANEILTQFPQKFRDMGASEEEAAAQTQALLADLGLLPADKQIMIQLTREEEARNALDAFRGVIETMPRDVQVAINTAIAEGDIEGALAILNEQLIHKGYDPIILPVDAETAPAEETVDGFANGAHPDATVDLYANDRPATDTTDTFTKKKRAVTPLDVNADTALAAGALIAFISQPRATTIYVGTSGVPEVSSTLNALDNPRTATINADANTGSAERELNNTARTRTATINVRTVTVNAHGSASVPEPGGIAGEAGPEYVRYPSGRKALLTATSYVPPGTMVVSTERTKRMLRQNRLPKFAQGTPGVIPMGSGSHTTVNVAINAGVIGNRFDVARAVTRANFDAKRLLGTRT